MRKQCGVVKNKNIANTYLLYFYFSFLIAIYDPLLNKGVATLLSSLSVKSCQGPIFVKVVQLVPLSPF